MKKTKLFLLMVFIGLNTLISQSPVGFNYQAVVRDSSGEIVADQTVGMRISLIKGVIDGEVVFQEMFTPTTNKFGVVNLVIGSVNPDLFANIDWSETNYFIKIELDVDGGTDYITMGTSQLLSVPYAQHAFSAAGWKTSYGSTYTEQKVGIGQSGPKSKLLVAAAAHDNQEAAIFEVKNRKGETVFAVYENSVEVYVGEKEGNKGRGGFAVSGRTTTKSGPEEILVVQPGLTQVFVDEDYPAKGRGGFAVSGRTTTKQEPFDLLHVHTDRTSVFLKDNRNKSIPESFTVSFLDDDYTSTNLFAVSKESTVVNTPFYPEGGVRITFFVTDTDGNPIQDAQIHMFGNEGMLDITKYTDQNGEAIFYNVPINIYVEYSVSAEGYGEYYDYIESVWQDEIINIVLPFR